MTIKWPHQQAALGPIVVQHFMYIDVGQACFGLTSNCDCHNHCRDAMHDVLEAVTALSVFIPYKSEQSRRAETGSGG